MAAVHRAPLFEFYFVCSEVRTQLPSASAGLPSLRFRFGAFCPAPRRSYGRGRVSCKIVCRIVDWASQKQKQISKDRAKISAILAFGRRQNAPRRAAGREDTLWIRSLDPRRCVPSLARLQPRRSSLVVSSLDTAVTRPSCGRPTGGGDPCRSERRRETRLRYGGGPSSRSQQLHQASPIGIGASRTARPLPHHRAYGSVHGDSAGEAAGETWSRGNPRAAK